MSVYKLFGVAPDNSKTDALAALDIQLDGFINAVFMNLDPNGMDALNDILACEVSFLSVNTFSSNDSRGSLMTMSLTQQFLTSGGGIGSGSDGISGLKVPVNGGERIFLHTSTNAGVTGDCTVYLYVDDGQDLKPSRRRR